MGFVNTVNDVIKQLAGNERSMILNVIVCYRNGHLKAYIIPRWTRLPVNYVNYFNDPDKTIKPGNADMSGLLITVDKDIYEYSTKENVWEALSYVASKKEDLGFFYQFLDKGIKDSPENFVARFPDLAAQVDGIWQRGIENGFIKKACLDGIITKTHADGLIVVQLNESRKTVVSHKKVAQRQKGEEACPYCIQEEGREDMPWNNYVISANPYPYSDKHIVIVNGKHVFQYIDEESIQVMVDFVTSAPAYSVSYNGPPGTTILGHMHFQAAVREMPAEKAATRLLVSDGDLRVEEVVGFPSTIFVVDKKIEITKQ